MRLFRDDKGLTITELMVVLSLMSLLLGVVYFVMHAVSTMADINIARAAASDQSQRFVDRAARELREVMDPDESVAGGVGKDAFDKITKNEVIFYADVAPNSSGAEAVPERVRYYVDGGAVYRQIAVCSDTVTPYKNFGAYSSAEKIVHKVDSAWNQEMFKYYQESSETVATSGSQVARVDVVMRASASSGQQERVVQTNITARCRSVHNSVGGS